MFYVCLVYKENSYKKNTSCWLVCFILPLFQNFHSIRWGSLTMGTKSILIFFLQDFWGPSLSPTSHDILQRKFEENSKKYKGNF